ncbi:hypothetical protein VTK73DRAFT_5962 [Phialemonium thermophilum]|uniref:Secreted protein n=1 Tax=Phialemonium thermophilum TaxID=223376 RepID=A0ABR3V1U0_9PEZI
MQKTHLLCFLFFSPLLSSSLSGAGESGNIAELAQAPSPSSRPRYCDLHGYRSTTLAWSALRERRSTALGPQAARDGQLVPLHRTLGKGGPIRGKQDKSRHERWARAHPYVDLYIHILLSPRRPEHKNRRLSEHGPSRHHHAPPWTPRATARPCYGPPPADPSRSTSRAHPSRAKTDP